MRILLISGNHLRHLYVMRHIVAEFPDYRAILMEREPTLPEPPPGIANHDRALFDRHFRERQRVEDAKFGITGPSDVFAAESTLRISPQELNSAATAAFVSAAQADVCVVFGPDLIKTPVLECLPAFTVNLHLGLSPWYRGSATLFWPFYFMQPQMAGVTIHHLVKAADAGGIITQSRPHLTRGMGIHDVGSAAVVRAVDDILEVLRRCASARPIEATKQTTPGRLFLVRDFQPHHLRVNYDIFDDRMVDAWLSGELGGNEPHLIRHIDD